MSSVPLNTGSARAGLIDMTAPLRSRVMASVKDSITESALADPDMWHCVKSGVGAALQCTLSHVELEIERSIQYSLMEQQANNSAQGPTGGPLCGHFYKFRAFVLHHYIPHNKSFFGKLGDPVYLFIYMLTCLPIHGLRAVVFAMILFMHIKPGPPDESQLINFIVSFKSMQFLSAGCIHLIMGAMQYFACYSFYKEACTTQYDAENARRAGGRLHALLCYDLKCFLVTACVLLFLTLASCWNVEGGSVASAALDPQLRANMFWCSVLYSLLAVPFLPFVIPCVQVILTHCDATGYNESGACVVFAWPIHGEEHDDVEESTSQTATRRWSVYAQVAANVLSLLEMGRTARDRATRPGDYVVGDIFRGMKRKVRANIRQTLVQSHMHVSDKFHSMVLRVRALAAAVRRARSRLGENPQSPLQSLFCAHTTHCGACAPQAQRVAAADAESQQTAKGAEVAAGGVRSSHQRE